MKAKKAKNLFETNQNSDLDWKEMSKKGIGGKLYEMSSKGREAEQWEMRKEEKERNTNDWLFGWKWHYYSIQSSLNFLKNLWASSRKHHIYDWKRLMFTI